MDTVRGLWLMVASQLALFGVFWLAMARLQPRAQRGGPLAVAAFNLVMAAGLALVEQRHSLPDWLAYPGSNVVQLLAMALLWHGGSLHLRGVGRREPFIIWALGSLAVVAAWREQPGGSLRVAAMFAATSWIFLRASWFAAEPLRARGPFGARMALVLRGVALFTACALTVRLSYGWVNGFSLDSAANTTGAQALAFGVLMGLTMANVTLAYSLVRGLIREQERLATADPLTGLLNRRAFAACAERRWAEWQRHGRAFAAIAIDIDHFKLVNDSCGHPAGDVALRMLARLLREQARPQDDVARMGGEEFVLLLADASPRSALVVAERLRAAVEAAAPLPELQGRGMCVSAGVAVVGAGDADAAQVLARADQALYGAKQAGRNRVQVAG